MPAGKSVYANACAACHQAGGEGIAGAFPPLAKSDFLLANRTRAIETVKKGLSGPIKVNGVAFDGVMPALGLSDEDVANVLTFVSNSWGNKAKMFTTSDVKKVK